MMLPPRSLPVRLLGFVVAAITLASAVPVPVHHHADHVDDGAHLERDHGGHGGLLEQDEARIPAPPMPATVTTVALRIPDVDRRASTRPATDDFLSPRERAPPADRPRAPPTPS